MAKLLAWSDFAKKQHSEWSGNSYTTMNPDHVVELVVQFWDQRQPGYGEGENLDRKVVVSIPTEKFFCPPRVALQQGMPVQAHVTVRQAGENPYVETYVLPDDAVMWGFKPEPAWKVEIVCYSADALLENDGKRSSDADWEIVAILCHQKDEYVPMMPLPMARNYLNKPGGTFTDYSSKDFAESIWYWSNQHGVKVKEVDYA